MTNIPSTHDIAEAFDGAPEYVREYMASETLSQTFESIRATNELHFDEADGLSRSINAVFLKLNTLQEFPALLREALDQNKDKYDAVLKDVNEKVFGPFREGLVRKTAGGAPEMDTEKPGIQATPSATPSATVGRTEVPATKTTAQKLSTTTSERNRFIGVDTLEREKEEQATLPKDSVPAAPKNQYPTGTDPYREPPE